MILKRLPARLLWACLLVAFLSALPLGAAEIVEAEYYLGEDPGEGNGTPVAIRESSNLTAMLEEASISLEGLAGGTYDIALRVRDDEGRWSVPIIRRFTYTARNFELAGGLDSDGPADQGVDQLLEAASVGGFAGGVSAEFYLGDDPGEGNGTSLPISENCTLVSLMAEASVSLAGLDQGTYDIGLRVQDDEGRWSNPIIRRFTYTARDFELAGGLDSDGPADQGVDQLLEAASVGGFAGGVSAEFYLGDDPGEGNGTSLPISENCTLVSLMEAASVSLVGLAGGTYDIGLRVQDDEGRWSNPIIRRFTYTSSDFELADGLDRNGPANQETVSPNADRLTQQWTVSLPENLEAREYLLQVGDLTISLEVTDPSARETVLAGLRQLLNSSLYVTSRMEVGAVSSEGINLTFLEPGRHSDSWVASEDFVVGLERTGSIGAAASRIVAAEYFLNVAPLPGNGIAVDIEGDGSSMVETIAARVLDITSFKPGTHAVGIRFRNAQGHWGNPVWRRLTSFSLFGDLDLEPPVLTLNGAATLEVGLGSEFADPGASALDAEDGDLSDQVVLRALPDTTLPGEQVIEYAVADRAGNVGTIQRTVVVTAQPVTTVSLIVAGPLTNGAVTGNQQTYEQGQEATLTAVPDPGYLFTGWTGDASGTGNPLTLVMDGDRTVGATFFAQDTRDPDQDGLSNYEELVVHGTDPDNPDTDGDGVDDGVELADETDPNDPNDFNFLNSGLVAYYPFNGNANDESGNGNDGTVNGATLTTDRNGEAGSAYDFEQDSLITVDFDDFAFGAQGSHTISTWARFSAFNNPAGRLINIGSEPCLEFAQQLDVRPGGPEGRRLTASVGEGCVEFRETSTAAPELDQWYHYTMVYEGGVAKLFVDGQYVTETPQFTKELPAVNILWLGGHRRNQDHLGQIDDVRIYNRALSEEEVSELYELEKPAPAPDTDSDGMPDDWERTHGLVVGIDDSGLDLDRDKNSNLLEWLAGTDPNDQGSTFRPLGTHDGTNYHLSVPTITGRSYKISISLNLQDWLPYGTLIGDDTSQVWTFDETTVPRGPFHSDRHPDRYFFRVEISIPEP